jgi:hypothetical protein
MPALLRHTTDHTSQFRCANVGKAMKKSRVSWRRWLWRQKQRRTCGFSHYVAYSGSILVDIVTTFQGEFPLFPALLIDLAWRLQSDGFFTQEPHMVILKHRFSTREPYAVLQCVLYGSNVFITCFMCSHHDEKHFPDIRKPVLLMSLVSGSNCRCEQLFSLMKNVKSKTLWGSYANRDDINWIVSIIGVKYRITDFDKDIYWMTTVSTSLLL